MTNKANSSSGYHELVTTTYVFNEDNQVFMRRDTQESVFPDEHGDIWYPVNFKWIPIMALEQQLNCESNL